MRRVVSVCVLAVVGALILGQAYAAAGNAQSLSRRSVATDEGQVSYWHRPGKGPCLILIPGSYSDSSQWAETVKGLHPDLRLVLFEIRGHGESWPPPTSGSIEQFARDVLNVADALQAKTFYVGGHSIGGMVALEVGRQRPQAVIGIISIEGWTNRDAAREAFGGRMYSTLTPEQETARNADSARVKARWTKEQVETFGKIWTQWDGSDFLRTTDLPILEIYGDRANEPPSLEQLRIPKRKNIEVLWLKGASHALPVERPKELAGAIMRFLDRVEKHRNGHGTE